MDGVGPRGGVGVFVAELGLRNWFFGVFGFDLGKKAEDIGGRLFVGFVFLPNQGVFVDFLTRCEFLQAAKIQRAADFSADVAEPPCRSLGSGLRR